MSDAQLTALQMNLDAFDTTAKERALLKLAEQLTVSPHSVAASVAKARTAGWSDAELAETVYLVSEYNMLTRIYAGFTLPPDEMHPYEPTAALPLLRCAAQPE
jgi:alkylhydroperoxidase family enzyme